MDAVLPELRFELILLIEGNDSEHVTIAYEAHMTPGPTAKSLVIGSMEIFRVVGGRIVEVYKLRATRKGSGNDAQSRAGRGTGQ